MTHCEDSSPTSFSPSTSFDNSNLVIGRSATSNSNSIGSPGTSSSNSSTSSSSSSHKGGFTTISNNINYLQMDNLEIGYCKNFRHQRHHRQQVNQFSHTSFMTFSSRSPSSSNPQPSSAAAVATTGSHSAVPNSISSTSTTSAAVTVANAATLAASVAVVASPSPSSVLPGDGNVINRNPSTISSTSAVTTAASTTSRNITNTNTPESSISSSGRSSPSPLSIGMNENENENSIRESESKILNFQSSSLSLSNTNTKGLSLQQLQQEERKDYIHNEGTATIPHESENDTCNIDVDVDIDVDDESNTDTTKRKRKIIKSSLQFMRNLFSSAMPLQTTPFLRIFTPSSPSTAEAATTTTTNSPCVASLFGFSQQIKSKSNFFSIKRIITFSILAVVIVFLTSFAQGVLHLMTYRNNFGHAPIPQSPTHGVIVAYPNNTVVRSNDGDGLEPIDQGRYSHDNNKNRHNNVGDTEMIMNYTFKAYNPSQRLHPLSSSSRQQPPLRVLVIGDSLARGVGQAHNCYPVLPQSLAKYLSRHLNGRTVYWSAMAQPGASTKWLSQLVEEEVKRKKKQMILQKQQQMQQQQQQEQFQNSPLLYSLKHFKEIHTSKSSSNLFTKEEWVSNLQYHQKLYEQNPFGDYDIVIVMSGLNDIKRMLVPFLLDDEVVEKEEGDESDQQQQQQQAERGFAADLKKLIHLLNYGNPQNHSLKKDVAEVSKSCPSGSSTNGVSPERTCTVIDEKTTKSHRELPMIVFPRFPTNINPVKMGELVRKIAIYMSGLMDNVKVRISNQYTNVISPDPPGPKTAFDYLRKHPEDEDSGGLVNKDSEVMINLIDTKCAECEQREKDMAEFYSTRHPKDYCIDSPVQQLFAPDGLHPSDFGYDYFGELLGIDIMEKWGHDRLQ